MQLGGPTWDVKVGRRDSTTASFSGANNNIPPPTSGLANLTSLFAAQGLSQKDMVALSGAYYYSHMHVLQIKKTTYSLVNLISHIYIYIYIYIYISLYYKEAGIYTRI
jgi:peroxidase